MTSVSVGTLSAEIINYVVSVGAGAIASMIVYLLTKLASGIGFSLDDARRKRLKEIVTNGLHAAAAKYADTAGGKIPFDLRSQVLADVVKYVEEHGADTLKALGADPKAWAEAIGAHFDVALADPNVPISMAPGSSGTALDAMEKRLMDFILSTVEQKLKPAA